MAHPAEPLDPSELVIVFIGGSAVGKSSIAECLTDSGVVQSTPTWATREPRPGERDTCYDHRFVTDEEFDAFSEQGGFIDEKALYGARYGVPRLRKPPAGKEALMVLKPLFIPAFLQHYPNARIHQIEASEESLEDRMRARGQTDEDIAERMRRYPQEVADAERFAHATFNNDGPLELTVKAVELHIAGDRRAHEAARPHKT